MLLNDLSNAGVTMKDLEKELKLPAEVIENKIAGREIMTLHEAGGIKRLLASKGMNMSYEEINGRATS